MFHITIHGEHMEGTTWRILGVRYFFVGVRKGRVASRWHNCWASGRPKRFPGFLLGGAVSLQLWKQWVFRACLYGIRGFFCRTLFRRLTVRSLYIRTPSDASTNIGWNGIKVWWRSNMFVCLRCFRFGTTFQALWFTCFIAFQRSQAPFFRVEQDVLPSF